MSDSLVVNEIYLSLQGESTFAGLPCIFVRLTACNLRCSYCDTAYAFTEGAKMTAAAALEKIRTLAAAFPKQNTEGGKQNASLKKAKRTSSTVVKAVTIPAWQFFRLIRECDSPEWKSHGI